MATGGKVVGVKPTTPRATARSVSAAVRRDKNSPAALIRSATCVVVKVIQWKPVQTSHSSCVRGHQGL